VPGDAQAAVIGGPIAIAEEMGRGEVGDQPEEFSVLGIGERLNEAAAEHAEPVFQSAISIL
jgi:hypothetical protein